MLVILGTGLAGYMLAKEWRKLDAHTPLVMITADDGAFYSKPLLSTALTQSKTAEQLIISTADTMAQELNAHILCGVTVKQIDPARNQIILEDQSQLAYSKLVIACGAKKNRPSLQGDAVIDLQTVNSLVEYRRFRHWLSGKKHLAILGSGLVGCEFANDLINIGYQVTVVAPEAYPLASLLPLAAGKLLQELLSEQGINWHLDSSMETLNYLGQQIKIQLTNQKELIVDGVFAAAGLQPETALASNAGIRVNRGICVDRKLQTNIPAIYALGDCAEVDGQVQMYVAPLLQCAKALAKILSGGQEPVNYPIMPIVLKTPALPLVFCPPPAGMTGAWRQEGAGHHLKMLFYDSADQLRGFVLAGDKIRDKMVLAKQLPVLFSI
ncbi:MAG: FAD-dependent oxidoreductase [Proteobacteria bacterium]|nr:FAD-dependent oxidoreductase [Pseudomonadota bacterium]